MNPQWIVALAAAFGPKIVDAFIAPRAGQPAAPRQAPPQHVPPHLAAKFSRIGDDGVRRFDADIAQKIPFMLASRAVESLPASPRAPGAHLWRVVPSRHLAMPASAAVDAAKTDGLTVLGSLSLIYLPTGQPVPMLLVACPPNLVGALANASTDLAVLATPTLDVPKEAPKPAAPTKQKNGVAAAPAAPKPESIDEAAKG